MNARARQIDLLLLLSVFSAQVRLRFRSSSSLSWLGLSNRGVGRIPAMNGISLGTGHNVVHQVTIAVLPLLLLPTLSRPGPHRLLRQLQLLFGPQPLCLMIIIMIQRQCFAFHSRRRLKLHIGAERKERKGFSSRDVMDIRAHELLFHGPAEWALRLLSHGRFVSVVPTRSVAESIPVSKLFDSTQLFQPAIDMMISSIASFAPTQQGAAASQNLLKLETELGKRKQQLRQQGVMLTPEKPATKSADPASSSEQKPGSHAVPIAGQQPSQQSSRQPELDYIPEDALSSHVKKLQGQFFCSTVMGENVQEPWEPTSMLSLKSLQWKSLLR